MSFRRPKSKSRNADEIVGISNCANNMVVPRCLIFGNKVILLLVLAFTLRLIAVNHKLDLTLHLRGLYSQVEIFHEMKKI